MHMPRDNDERQRQRVPTAMVEDATEADQRTSWLVMMRIVVVRVMRVWHGPARRARCLDRRWWYGCGRRFGREGSAAERWHVQPAIVGSVVEGARLDRHGGPDVRELIDATLALGVELTFDLMRLVSALEQRRAHGERPGGLRTVVLEVDGDIHGAGRDSVAPRFARHARRPARAELQVFVQVAQYSLLVPRGRCSARAGVNRIRRTLNQRHDGLEVETGSDGKLTVSDRDDEPADGAPVCSGRTSGHEHDEQRQQRESET